MGRLTQHGNPLFRLVDADCKVSTIGGSVAWPPRRKAVRKVNQKCMHEKLHSMAECSGSHAACFSRSDMVWYFPFKHAKAECVSLCFSRSSSPSPWPLCTLGPLGWNLSQRIQRHDGVTVYLSFGSLIPKLFWSALPKPIFLSTPLRQTSVCCKRYIIQPWTNANKGTHEASWLCHTT